MRSAPPSEPSCDKTPATTLRIITRSASSALCEAPHKAEFERAMIVERVKAGLSRARAQGKRLGRRPVSSDVVERIRTQIGDRRGHPENGQGTRRRDRNSSSGQTGNENCGGLTGYDTRRQSPKSI